MHICCLAFLITSNMALTALVNTASMYSTCLPNLKHMTNSHWCITVCPLGAGSNRTHSEDLWNITAREGAGQGTMEANLGGDSGQPSATSHASVWRDTDLWLRNHHLLQRESPTLHWSTYHQGTITWCWSTIPAHAITRHWFLITRFISFASVGKYFTTTVYCNSFALW